MVENNNDNWKATPEEIEEWTEKFRQDRAEINKQRIERLKILEQPLDSKLVGIWGHLTNIGVREHGVFQENHDDQHYFIIVGRSEDVITAETLEERNRIARELVAAGVEGKMVTFGEQRKEIGDFVIRDIDPKKTPNGHPVRPIEKFLEE